MQTAPSMSSTSSMETAKVLEDYAAMLAPKVPKPLMQQELAKDGGVTLVGAPIKLLDHSDADGPLIEAPNMILVNGAYFLFFSSNCYNTPLYDVTWAAASSMRGPFTKRGPLLVSNKPFQVTAPGGAIATVGGKSLVFHANCDARRCMCVTGIKVSGTEVNVAQERNPEGGSGKTAHWIMDMSQSS